MAERRHRERPTQRQVSNARKRHRRQRYLVFEYLEDRHLLSAVGGEGEG